MESFAEYGVFIRDGALSKSTLEISEWAKKKASWWISTGRL
jgi:hypothetical protein